MRTVCRRLVFSLFALVSAQASALELLSEGKTPAQDRAVLEKIQSSAFNYAKIYSSAKTGLVCERSNDRNLASTSATGFAVASIPVAVQRGFITRAKALQWLKTLTDFLLSHPQRKAFHGAMAHWMNASTGEPLPFSQGDTAADLVETSFLFQGLLIARAYFNGSSKEEKALRHAITQLWEELDFTVFLTEDKNGLFWHLNPKGASLKMPIRGFNEALVTYVLALSSPTHAIDAKALQTWYQNPDYETKSYWGYTIEGSPIYSGPLFHSHYSFIGIDPRAIADYRVPSGYFKRSVTQALIHRAYCLNVAPKASFQSDLWGLTCTQSSNGYIYQSPIYEAGVVAPTAAICSIAYVPEYATEVLYRIANTQRFMTTTGPVDAIEKKTHWISSVQIGIDQLPMVALIENYRSGLLWKLFMTIPEIQNGLKKTGFHPPVLETGFSEMPLTMEEERSLCDIRRHPDTECYEILYATDAPQEITLQLKKESEEIVLKTTLTQSAGQHQWRLPKNFKAPLPTLKAEIITPSGSESIIVRFH